MHDLNFLPPAGQASLCDLQKEAVILGKYHAADTGHWPGASLSSVHLPWQMGSPMTLFRPLQQQGQSVDTEPQPDLRGPPEMGVSEHFGEDPGPPAIPGTPGPPTIARTLCGTLS
jgi:hypothetical protein